MANASAVAPDVSPGRGWRRPAMALSGRAAEYAVTACALAADTALLLAAQGRRAPLLLLLAGHALVSAGMLQLVARRFRQGADTIPSLIAALLTLVAGPVGAGIALVGLFLAGRSRHGPELLEEWYDRIAYTQKADPVQQLCDGVAIGRALDLVAPSPRSFTAVISEGSIADRQAALGLIARRFRPEYAPALHAALKSEEPVIRVQAAAVAARVREGLERRLPELLRRASGSGLAPAAALLLAADIGDCLAGDLIDESAAVRGRQAIAELLRRAVGEGESGTLELAGALNGVRRQGGAGAVRRMLAAVEAEFLRTGQFARLRGLRRIAGPLVRGRYHLRRRLIRAAPRFREVAR